MPFRKNASSDQNVCSLSAANEDLTFLLIANVLLKVIDASFEEMIIKEV